MIEPSASKQPNQSISTFLMPKTIEETMGSGTKASTANPSAIKKEIASPAKPAAAKTASPIKKKETPVVAKQDAPPKKQSEE